MSGWRLKSFIPSTTLLFTSINMENLTYYILDVIITLALKQEYE